MTEARMIKLALLIVLVVTCSVVRAQNIPNVPIPPETSAALDQIDKAFDLNLKGWTRERYTPFQPSSGLAELWETSGRSVRVFISKLGPRTPGLFEKDLSGTEPLEGICDEARVFGYDGNVSCRHGDFGISISSAVHLQLFSRDGPMTRGIEQAEAKAT